MKEESKNKFRDSLGDLLNDLPDEVPGLEDTLRIQLSTPISFSHRI